MYGAKFSAWSVQYVLCSTQCEVFSMCYAVWVCGMQCCCAVCAEKWEVCNVSSCVVGSMCCVVCVVQCKVYGV